MKKLILVLLFVLAFTLPVFATNSITAYIEHNDSQPDKIYTDYLELYLENKVNDNLTTGLTFDLNDINTVNPMSIDANLDLIFAKGHTVGIGTGIDLTTNEFTYIKGKILNYSISDDLAFNTKAKYSFDGTYWAVANVVFGGEKIGLVLEARTDSDGFVPYSYEAQLTFGVTEDIDITVGYEVNDWDDDINDWDAMAISSDANTAYAKVVVRF